MRFRFVKCLNVDPFHRIGPLGRFDLVVAMSVCVRVCLSICLSVPFRIYALMYMFAPTSLNRMLTFFRDSESLGKSAGKKRSQN